MKRSKTLLLLLLCLAAACKKPKKSTPPVINILVNSSMNDVTVTDTTSIGIDIGVSFSVDTNFSGTITVTGLPPAFTYTLTTATHAAPFTAHLTLKRADTTSIRALGNYIVTITATTTEPAATIPSASTSITVHSKSNHTALLMAGNYTATDKLNGGPFVNYPVSIAAIDTVSEIGFDRLIDPLGSGEFLYATINSDDRTINIPTDSIVSNRTIYVGSGNFKGDSRGYFYHKDTINLTYTSKVGDTLQTFVARLVRN